jgi:hypothetical protein
LAHGSGKLIGKVSAKDTEKFDLFRGIYPVLDANLWAGSFRPKALGKRSQIQPTPYLSLPLSLFFFFSLSLFLFLAEVLESDDPLVSLGVWLRLFAFGQDFATVRLTNVWLVHPNVVGEITFPRRLGYAFAVDDDFLRIEGRSSVNIMECENPNSLLGA